MKQRKARTSADDFHLFCGACLIELSIQLKVVSKKPIQLPKILTRQKRKEIQQENRRLPRDERKRKNIFHQ